jgi:DNA polymerase-1
MIYLVSNQLGIFDQEFTYITLETAIQLLAPLAIVGADTETQGLDCHTKKLLTIQLGNADFQIVFDINSYDGIIPTQLKDYLNTSEQLFLFQNAKFDLQFLYKQNVIIKHVYDTFLAETILTMGLQFDGRALDDLVYKYCPGGYMDKSIRGQINQVGLNSAVIKYAANDVVYLERIMEAQLVQAKNIGVVGAIKLDNEFVKVLAYIEFCGIKLDWEKWSQKSALQLDDVFKKRNELTQWLKDNNYTEYFSPMINIFTGERECTLNWDSPLQVIKLFESIGINCTIVDKGVEKKTVEEKAIGKYKDQFPILKLYFDYKAAAKLASTYGYNWKTMINPATGRIHTSFKQIMNTGRLSSGDTKTNKPKLNWVFQ